MRTNDTDSTRTSERLALLEKVSRMVMLPGAEASGAFGVPVPSRAEELDEWVHGAEADLEALFEVVWDATAEGDLESLDRVAEQWEEVPEEEALHEIALAWGALVGERILEAVGGSWAYRQEPLHHSVHFPRQDVDFFPMHAVVARFMLGEQAGLEAAYHRLVEFLTEN